MNRRNFLKSLATAAAAFSILPAATTYGRTWVVTAKKGCTIYIPNPEWVNAPYEMVFSPYLSMIENGTYPLGIGNLPIRFDCNGHPISPFIQQASKSDGARHLGLLPAPGSVIRRID